MTVLSVKALSSLSCHNFFALLAAALMILSTASVFVATCTYRVVSSEIFSLVYTLDLFVLPAFMVFLPRAHQIKCPAFLP